MNARNGSTPSTAEVEGRTRKWSHAGRVEAQRRAELRRHARHLMRGAGMTDEDIAVVLRTSPEGVRKAFHRDELKVHNAAPRNIDADGLEWED